MTKIFSLPAGRRIYTKLSQPLHGLLNEEKRPLNYILSRACVYLVRQQTDKLLILFCNDKTLKDRSIEKGSVRLFQILITFVQVLGYG